MNDPQHKHKLQDAIAKMQRDLSPERDLWPGITHAINTPARNEWHRTAALAASIVLVFGMSLYFSTRQSADSLQNSRIEEYIGVLQYEHQQTKQALLVQYENQPALYQEWEVQMKDLEQAEQVIFQALRDDPENLELLKILRQVQAKQIELLDAAFAPRLNTI
ncbi:MAG: hypothetical protein V4628_13085 [Pseudomonadota bacterium]